MVENIIQLLEYIKDNFGFSEELISNLKVNRENAIFLKGNDKIIKHIQNMSSIAKSLFLLYTPQILPDVLPFISQKAYEKKGVRFIWINHIDIGKYYPIISKILMFGNIQFRDLEKDFDFCYSSRDTSEILIGKFEENSTESIAIVYELDNLTKNIDREIGSYLLKESGPFLSEGEKIKRAKLKRKVIKKIEKNPEKKLKILEKYKFKESELEGD